MSMQFDSTNHPHRRVNPLTGEHILVSPHRAKRPWLGQVEQDEPSKLPEYDPECYLCPGNTRAGGDKNPSYQDTFVFSNDFAAVLPSPAPLAPSPPHPLLTSEPVHGGCDVLIFHPRHDLTLARLGIPEIEKIIEEWQAIYLKRGRQEGIEYVQIFENKGSMMGCSNPHPHGQVWSMSAVPTIPATELRNLKEYSLSDAPDVQTSRGPKGRPCLLCDYAAAEVRLEERIVIKNMNWIALVPWWAVWPFEVLVLPYRRHIPSLATLTAEEKTDFADIVSRLTKRYDNLFETSFAYSMGVHQRPVPPAEGTTIPEDEDEDNLAHLHLHFDPPLLRNASVRKFLVGFELMAEAQRDLTSEQAAQRLRDLSEVHYKDSNK